LGYPDVFRFDLLSDRTLETIRIGNCSSRSLSLLGIRSTSPTTALSSRGEGETAAPISPDS